MTDSDEIEEIIETNHNTQKDHIDKKYIMFVCKKCGLICVTLPEYFISINPGDVIENHSNQISFSLNPNISVENADNHNPQDDIFQKGLNNFLELSKSPFFPWCLSCTRDLEERVQSRVKYLKNAENIYSQIDIPEKSIFQEILEDTVSKLDSDTTSIKEKIQDINIDNKIQLESDTATSQLEESLSHDPNKLLPHSKSDLYSQFFRSLVLPTVFHIGVKGTFVTINSLRLGQNKTWGISNDELDRSFFFLAQLVKNSGRITNVDVSAIQISTDIQIKLFDVEDDNTKTTERKKAFSFQSLFKKGSNNNLVLLKASDMKKSKTLSRFNQALDVIFTLSSQIFNAQSTQTNIMTPPYLILPEEHTIAGHSYLFDAKDPYLWSHNMRLLLFDYALFFTSCLRNAVLSIED